METIETLGKYEIKRTLGRGAMGTVYEGWDPIIARRVAIKTVKIPDADDPETEDQLARFRREAQAAGRLTHPNIVGVFDYGETNDIAYIVMEYVDGPSVKSLLDKQERFALPDVMRIMEDLLAGLQFSHERGVVHRDIKPANVMLTTQGQAKIADFGIARIESSSMTQAGTVLGTPAYMSPEQFMGQVVDKRSDIYSSGVLLYQLLTGERPFEGGLSAIMHKALNTEPPAPSQIAVTCSPAFDPVVRKSMAKRPEDRFQSATDFLQALRAAAAGGRSETLADAEEEATMVAAPGAAQGRPIARPREAPAGTQAPPAATAPRKSPVALIVAAVLVVLLAAGGGWFFLSRGSAPTQTAAAGPGSSPATGAASAAAPAPSAAAEPRTAQAAASAQQTGSSTSQTASSAQPAGSSAPQTAPVPPQAGSSAPQAASAPPAQGSATPAEAPAPAQTAAPPRQTAGSTLPASRPDAAPPQAAPFQTGSGAGTAASTTQGTAGPAEVRQAQAAPSSSPPATSPQPATPPAAANGAGNGQQVASTSLQAIRRQVQEVIAGQRCATLNGAVQDGGTIAVTGLAGRTAADAVRDALAGSPLDWQVKSVDPYYCRALGVVHPIAGGGLPLGAQLRLSLAHGVSRLYDGQRILPQVVMPEFRGYLRVDYVAHDGEVMHLYPQVADPSQNVTADPSHAFAPGTVVKLGEASPGHPVWEVGEPYGTDMIIAVASSQPLFPRPRPANVEPEAIYLRQLQDAVDTARQRGDQLAGTAIALDTLAKK